MDLEQDLIKSTTAYPCLCKYGEGRDYRIIVSHKMKPVRDRLVALHASFVRRKGNYINYNKEPLPNEKLKKHLNNSCFEIVREIIQAESTHDGSNQVLFRGPAAIYFVNLPVRTWISNICAAFRFAQKELFTYSANIRTEEESRNGILNEHHYNFPHSLSCRETLIKLDSPRGIDNHCDLFYANSFKLANMFTGSENQGGIAKFDVPDEVIAYPGFGVVFLPCYRHKLGDFRLQMSQVQTILSFSRLQQTVREDIVFIFVIEKFFCKSDKALQMFLLLMSHNDLLRYVKIHPRNGDMANLDMVLTLYPDPRLFSDTEFGLHEFALTITDRVLMGYKTDIVKDTLSYFDRYRTFDIPAPNEGFDLKAAKYVFECFEHPMLDSMAAFENRKDLRYYLNYKMVGLYLIGFWLDCKAEFENSGGKIEPIREDSLYPYNLLGHLQRDDKFGHGYTQELMGFMAFSISIVKICEERVKTMEDRVDMLTLAEDFEDGYDADYVYQQTEGKIREMEAKAGKLNLAEGGEENYEYDECGYSEPEDYMKEDYYSHPDEAK